MGVLLSANVGHATPKQKTSRVRFADTKIATEQIKQIKQIKQKVHVNVLLENKISHTKSSSLPYSIIGFVIIKDNIQDLLTLLNLNLMRINSMHWVKHSNSYHWLPFQSQENKRN